MMNRFFKKVTTMIAAAAIAFTTLAGSMAMPVVVHAADFSETYNLKDLPAVPTRNMDVNIIKNYYKQGDEIAEGVQPGTVAYIKSLTVSALDITSPQGSDIVLVYKVYRDTGMFGTCKGYRVSCKSLTNGQTFDIALGGPCAHLYKLDKITDVNEPSVAVSESGLKTPIDTTVKTVVDWCCKIFGLIK